MARPSREGPQKATATRLDPVGLVREVCAIAGNRRYLTQLREWLADQGVVDAVAQGKSGPIFEWLCRQFAYQGIANGVAAGHIEVHGSARYADLEAQFKAGRATCPKLGSFAGYVGCRFKKHAWTCANPGQLESCLVPMVPARKGSLSETAVSLYLFIRDVANGDLVGLIDRTIGSVDAPRHPDLIARRRLALLGRLRPIRGVSDKLLAMTFSDLLVGAGAGRDRWVEVGGSMVAVDTLVHNFLHRTGIIARSGRPHPYGPACYRPGGCAEIVDRIARAIDCRQFASSLPPYFPRFVQHSIWAFCAEGQLGICNGRTIDDRERCANTPCPLYVACPRVALRPAPSEPDAAKTLARASRRSKIRPARR